MDIEKIIHQVFHNPQVTFPPISYTITDHGNTSDDTYTSEYIDHADFKDFLVRLEKQLIARLAAPKTL